MPRPLTLAARLLLVLALFASTQGALLVRGLFEVRQEWIAEHLCVNRHHPERKCDGKCYLMRKMEEHDHDGEGRKNAVLTVPNVVALLASETTVPPDRWRETEAPTAAEGPASTSRMPDGVFRPPRMG